MNKIWVMSYVDHESNSNDPEIKICRDEPTAMMVAAMYIRKVLKLHDEPEEQEWSCEVETMIQREQFSTALGLFHDGCFNCSVSIKVYCQDVFGPGDLKNIIIFI